MIDIDPKYIPPEIKDWHWVTNSDARTAKQAENEYRDTIFCIKTRDSCQLPEFIVRVEPFCVVGDPEIRFAVYVQGQREGATMTKMWSDCDCNWLENGCPTCAGCEDMVRLYLNFIGGGGVHWNGKHWHERCLLTHLVEQLKRAELGETAS